MNDNSFFSDAYRACEHLVRDYAPLMMLAGGGGIQACGYSETRKPLTDRERARIVRLHIEKGYTLNEVAELVHRPSGTVGAVVAKFKKRGHALGLKPGAKPQHDLHP